MSTVNRGVNIGPPRFKLAVHALIWIASNGGLLSSATIARQVESHATFMRRVMQSLAAAGIVTSKSGREGGYLLSKQVECITLGEVYKAVSLRSVGGLLEGNDGEAVAQLDQELNGILREAEKRAIDYLQQYTISDVMNRIDFFKL
ncbi:BadM/Rrf2 family transcriptional regulator [Paenibacillus cellulosilyticus]|uniref:BadM/Rrf2 family transcriptional regulator n=1 Tax=Paenibacillus cellulosilyticus TaxID=375489 RepID=A0A2V2YP76_9BACL|nr:Rrf2 family transcriptional regulator [Paenibacillus cellulosilyticus]PWV97965.1 BadM/Rrf2 family transcriptional regulator [Paenibacillus cellulosilyticus]QKS44004.1 Rrf2 family transcriptional regulator [Paenibacillus cellulosilyticus]